MEGSLDECRSSQAVTRRSWIEEVGRIFLPRDLIVCLIGHFCYTRPYFLLSDSAKEECAPESFDPAEDKGYDSVVVGLSPPHFRYDVLTTAFRILKREAPYASPEPPSLIATHKAKYISDSSNQLSLGPGPFVSALESAADVQATVVGKPTRAFFQLVISSLDLPENPGMGGKIAVIGDDVEADLGGGAVELGLWRILGSFDVIHRASCIMHRFAFRASVD